MIASPTRELLTWIDARPRTYREVLEAWHSHCPRLTVWEDASGRSGVLELTATVAAA